ncbi:MAG: isoprenylcysteine carboxylmethyltransferase family protein [Pseudomonadota bacterium]|nr:isoprenylcysteine carboxylmethyltransferase family protein [Pseudomonadota bacterium]
MPAEISIPRIIARFVTGFGVLAAVFFWSAGTFNWPEAWLYLVIQFLISGAEAVWLKRNDPELLKERMTFLKSSAKGWDKAFMWISTVVSIPYLLLPGLDAVRYQWSLVPIPVQAIAFGGVIASLLLVFRVLRENPFLSRVVEVQRERSHRVITTGPYRVVRHPMYTGVVVLFFCIPLALGSLWSLIPAALLAALIIVRIPLEEKTLHAELEGYSAYAGRVQYRLFPGVW